MLSSIVKRIAPGLQTCNQFAVDYLQIIQCRQVCKHTIDNKRCSMRHFLSVIGEERIRNIKPLHVAKVIRDIQISSPVMAKRVLFEIRDFFTEAVLAGLIDFNPASSIKPPRCAVLRKRLSLDQWIDIRKWSAIHQPPWCSRMLELALVTAQRRSDLRVLGPSNIIDDKLYVSQIKTGSKIIIPIDLKLDVIGKSIRDVVESCEHYANAGKTFIRRASGKRLVDASLSARFEEARNAVGIKCDTGNPPSLHECRSLSERLYRAQGVDTRILLGHKYQAMTDQYNDDRGSFGDKWEELKI